MKVRKWVKAKWRAFRKWVIGVLVAIGLVSVPVVMAGTKDFSWTNPTENTDGSVFNPATDQQDTRIYCTRNGSEQVPVIVVPGAETAYTATLPPGDYQCYATVSNLDGVESGPSNSVSFTVDLPIPLPPTLNP